MFVDAYKARQILRQCCRHVEACYNPAQRKRYNSYTWTKDGEVVATGIVKPIFEATITFRPGTDNETIFRYESAKEMMYCCKSADGKGHDLTAVRIILK
jgi:hypothetical protein